MMIVTDEQIKQRYWDELSDEFSAQEIALAYHLNNDSPDYDDAYTGISNGDYLVLTDEEADEAVRENIDGMVWAFNPSFLSAHIGLDERPIKAIQEMCEEANEPLKAMIKDFDYFVEDAVRADGRGHFLASYDHEENEITFNGITYYIYRRN
tara:strand:+ start:16 stop:471 length:456 start_codon:yes stop_codon:yes gene_type:complete